jgi:hypothetical protein
MTITIPNGQPNHRFTRYVRPPVKESEKHPPLFPLRPATRQLRLGIDTTTVPAPPNGYLPSFFGRDEIEVQLLVPAEEEVPAAWTEVLDQPLVRQIGFTSIDEVGRELDTVYFWIKTETETEHSSTRAHFFDVFQHFDAQTAPPDAAALTIELRHHAAAYAAAAAALGIDAIVTNAPTAGRSDVADNDMVVSVTPDEAVALIGHYLRMTENPIVEVQRGRLVGGGSWERTESTATTANLYDWGAVSAMTYFDVIPHIATQMGDLETANAVHSIRVRLVRAVRALDRMLGALSNHPIGNRKEDVIETAAEAFDRALLYLAAAFDIYGRRYLLLIDPPRDPSRFRISLDARGYLTDHVNREYDPAVLADVARLHVYTGVCKVLRNHIHDGILPVDQHPGRQYGNSVSIALNLDAMPELAPGANNGMEQEHFDALGVWRADPASAFGIPVTVADLATTGTTLVTNGLALVEAFTKLILRNTPLSATAPSPLLGCVQAQPGEVEPPLPERAMFHQALFGWHST